jgi:hypothetical protein
MIERPRSKRVIATHKNSCVSHTKGVDILACTCIICILLVAKCVTGVSRFGLLDPPGQPPTKGRSVFADVSTAAHPFLTSVRDKTLWKMQLPP